MEEKTNSMRVLQQELDQLREENARENEMAARRAREDDEEIQMLRERLEADGGGDVSSLPTSCRSFKLNHLLLGRP